jgi:hypothetical protein
VATLSHEHHNNRYYNGELEDNGILQICDDKNPYYYGRLGLNARLA